MNMIIEARSRPFVSASGQMGADLERQANAHDVAQRPALLKPAVDRDRHQAAGGSGGGQQAVPDLAHVQVVQRVEDHHRPRGAPGDVEGEDGQRQGPHRRVAEQPAQAMADIGPDPAAGRRGGADRAGADLPDHQDRRDHDHRLPEEGPGASERKQKRPERRADQLLTDHEAPCTRELARPRSSSCSTSIGSKRAGGGVGEGVGDTRAQHRNQDPRHTHTGRRTGRRRARRSRTPGMPRR